MALQQPDELVARELVRGAARGSRGGADRSRRKIRSPPSAGVTMITRRSSVSRRRSTRPRASMRSTTPVTLATEMSSASARRLIDIGPLAESSIRTLRWTRLTWPWCHRWNAATNSRGFQALSSSTTSWTSRRLCARPFGVEAAAAGSLCRLTDIQCHPDNLRHTSESWQARCSRRPIPAATLARWPRRPDPESIIRAQVVLDEHDMSADGRFAVVVRRFVVADRYRSHLWLIPLARAPASRSSSPADPVRDTAPRLAPDGSAVAFRRSAAQTPGRKHKRHRRGPPGRRHATPDPAALSGWRRRRARRGPSAPPRTARIGEVVWSPDSSRLAVTLEVDPPRFLVGPDAEGRGRADGPPDHADRLAVGRRGHDRSLVPPPRRRRPAWRDAPPGDLGRLGRVQARLVARRSNRRLRRRTGGPMPTWNSVRRSGPSMSTATGAEPVEVLKIGGAAEQAGVVAGRALDRGDRRTSTTTRSTTRARSSSLRRRTAPRRRGRSHRPSIGRSGPGTTRTCTAGWRPRGPRRRGSTTGRSSRS